MNHQLKYHHREYSWSFFLIKRSSHSLQSNLQHLLPLKRKLNERSSFTFFSWFSTDKNLLFHKHTRDVHWNVMKIQTSEKLWIRHKKVWWNVDDCFDSSTRIVSKFIQFEVKRHIFAYICIIIRKYFHPFACMNIYRCQHNIACRGGFSYAEYFEFMSLEKIIQTFIHSIGVFQTVFPRP